jgi:ribosomal protein L2
MRIRVLTERDMAEIVGALKRGDVSAAQDVISNAPEVPIQEIGKGKAGPGRGKKAFDTIKSFSTGTSADYLAGRLKRDAPDIAAAVERGEYRSIRQAAIAAGIVKQRTPALPYSNLAPFSFAARSPGVQGRSPNCAPHVKTLFTGTV